jgi:hypothetical protein
MRDFGPVPLMPTVSRSCGQFIAAREEFCQWPVLSQVLCTKMLFTAWSFLQEGWSKRHEIRTSGMPRWQILLTQWQEYFQTVNVRCSFVGNLLVAPVERGDRLTDSPALPQLLQDVPLEVRRQVWLQQDGAPARSIFRYWLSQSTFSRPLDRPRGPSCLTRRVTGPCTCGLRSVRSYEVSGVCWDVKRYGWGDKSNNRCRWSVHECQTDGVEDCYVDCGEVPNVCRLSGW